MTVFRLVVDLDLKRRCLKSDGPLFGSNPGTVWDWLAMLLVPDPMKIGRVFGHALDQLGMEWLGSGMAGM